MSNVSPVAGVAGIVKTLGTQRKQTVTVCCIFEHPRQQSRPSGFTQYGGCSRDMPCHVASCIILGYVMVRFKALQISVGAFGTAVSRLTPLPRGGAVSFGLPTHTGSKWRCCGNSGVGCLPCTPWNESDHAAVLLQALPVGSQLRRRLEATLAE